LNKVSGLHQVESVHHAKFPNVTKEAINQPLEKRMQLAQDACSLLLSIRKKVNIKVRQPLQKVLIPVLDAEMKNQMMLVEDLIKAEVNVKEIEYLNPDNAFIQKKIKPNFVALGKKLGGKMKQAAAIITAFDQDQIRAVEFTGAITIQLEGEAVEIYRDEVDIQSEDVPGWMVANKNNLTVALDITISEELEQEGNARELVNRIQKIRKDNGYALTDRIVVQLTKQESLQNSFTKYNAYICAEILADRLELVEEISEGIDIDVNEIPLKVSVEKLN
jgi:isoleucyl-tRNA synthetase